MIKKVECDVIVACFENVFFKTVHERLSWLKFESLRNLQNKPRDTKRVFFDCLRMRFIIVVKRKADLISPSLLAVI